MCVPMCKKISLKMFNILKKHYILKNLDKVGKKKAASLIFITFPYKCLTNVDNGHHLRFIIQIYVIYNEAYYRFNF